MTFDFHHASPPAPLVNLGIAHVRIHDAFGFFARVASTSGARERFGCAVVGNQCGHIRPKLITGEEGSTAIGAGLEFGQKHGRFCFAALMAEVAQDAQAAGQRHSTPYPHIADIRGIIRLAMRLFFLTKVQSSSIWTWVRWRLRMRAALTAAVCCPAKSSQWRMRLGE